MIRRWAAGPGRTGLTCALLGSVCLLGQAPFHLWAFWIAAFAGFVWILDRARTAERPAKAAAWRAWCFGFGYYLALLFWVGNAFAVRGPEYEALMPISMAALPAGLALFHLACGVIYVRTAQAGSLRFIWLACLLFFVEVARSTAFGGLPWGLPGAIWEAGGAVSQAASLVGVWGLTLLAILLAAGAARWADGLASEGGVWRRGAGAFAASLVVLAGFAVFGAVRLDRAESGFVDGVVIRLVQPDIPQRIKFDAAFEQEALNRYLSLTGAPGLDEVTHVIWPESAIPGWPPLLQNPEKLRQIKAVVGPARTLITGVTRYQAGADRWLVYNSAVILTFSGDTPRLEGRYDKVKLVPFGERMPLREVLRALGLDGLADIGPMIAGKTVAPLAAPGAPDVVLSICYEGIFPDFIPRAASRPGWVVNMTNDAWFGTSIGPRQHFNLARYRTIEEGLPMARATVGGASAIFDSYGRLHARIDFGTIGFADSKLPKALRATVYSRLGFWAMLAFAFGLAIVSRAGPVFRAMGENRGASQ